MTLVPKTIPLSTAVWLTAYPRGPSESEYLIQAGNVHSAMETLLDDARAEWIASGRDGKVVDSLLDNLSEGYKAVQASVGIDNFSALLQAIGPNTRKLMTIASARLMTVFTTACGETIVMPGGGFTKLAMRLV